MGRGGTKGMREKGKGKEGRGRKGKERGRDPPKLFLLLDASALEIRICPCTAGPIKIFLGNADIRLTVIRRGANGQRVSKCKPS